MSTAHFHVLDPGVISCPYSGHYPKFNTLNSVRWKDLSVLQNSSAVRLLPIDPVASGSNPPSAKITPRARRVPSSL